MSTPGAVRPTAAATTLVPSTSGAAIAILLLSITLSRPCLADDPHEPNDRPEDATPLEYGDETYPCEIAPEGDVDFYRFSGRAGEVVDIRAHVPVLGKLDGRIWLLDESGVVLADNDDYEGPANSRLTVILAEDGDYLIRYAYRENLPSETSSAKLGSVLGSASGQRDSWNGAETEPAYDPTGSYNLFLRVMEPPTARNLVAGNGFAGVVPLGWDQVHVTSLTGTPVVVGVERSTNGGADFEYLGSVEENRFLDTTVENGVEAFYRIRADYPNGLGTTFSEVAAATSSATGIQVSSRYTRSSPTIDGDLREGEWSHAARLRLVDETSGEETSTLYVMNDERYLYFASNASGVFEFGFHFDSDNDDSYGSSGQEGTYSIVRNRLPTFQSITGDYPDHQFGEVETRPPGVTALIRSGIFVGSYEARFDLEASRLSAEPGDVLGFCVFDRSQSDRSVYPPGPPDMIFVAPRTFADLTLAVPSAELFLPVTELDFLDTAVGRETTEFLRIENRGAELLEITSLELIGEGVESFEVRTDVPFVLDPDEAREVTLAFVPLAHGEVEATLRIRSNDPAQVAEVALSGISVNQPPELQVRNPVAHGVAGEPLEIQAECIDDLLLANVTGEYVTGSGSRGQIVLVQEAGKIYRGLIPGNVLGADGLQYRIVAIDGEQAASTTGWFDVVVKTPRLESPALPGGTAQNAYRMISIPSLLDDGGAGVFTESLGSYDPKIWRLFALEEDEYVEQRDRQSIAPGEGLWLIARDGAVLATGRGESIPQSEPFRVPLRAGWTLIGNPFVYPISPERLSLAGGGNVDIRRYDQSWSSTTSLVPWEGYAVFSEVEDELLIYPNSPDTTAVQSDVAQHPVTRGRVHDRATPNSIKTDPGDVAAWDEWEVAIHAQCQDARDTDNIAGVRPAARAARDPYDLAEPPPIGEYVSLYFHRPQWSSVTSRFCTDLRAPAAQHAYPFCVESNIDDHIRLEFELQTLPEDATVWLVDRLTSAAWNLRVESRIEIGPARTGPREMELVVSRAASDDVPPDPGSAGILPVNGSIAFPNPAHFAVTLVYELPQSQAVSIAIFGVRGERVRTLREREDRSKGRHAIVWDGRDDAGSVVARGSYFYRIAGDSFSAHGRILLVE